MVNTEEFTKRLHKVMDYYDLSAASFADKIDVGRSSISHLLSGRNKPSLDFVMKIIQAFPEVELYWLLNGKGSFPTKMEQSSPPPVISSKTVSPERNLFSEEDKMPENLPAASGSREIKKIVIFYSDGSFEAYEN
ncbi:MAG: helix-turn-helix transcriptional regulator [Salinimicrobium sp.]